MYYMKTMEMRGVICKKRTAKTNSSVKNTKQNRSMLVPNCSACGKKSSSSLKIKKLVDY